MALLIRHRAKGIVTILESFLRQPRLSVRLLGRLPFALRGFQYSQRYRQSWKASAGSPHETMADSPNPLKSYFDSHTEGRGIWKLLHYFDIYHHHFRKFVGREVHVLEIGVYSGGSLAMWRECFGSQCHVYGVDIHEACKLYEEDGIKIFVGDQADRAFWKSFKERVPTVDILVDDGGHQPEQQIVTLEEMLPHLRPGGIYLCEDVTGDLNRFNAYVQGLATHLNYFAWTADDNMAVTTCAASAFQSAIRSIHLYPFVTVIEKTDRLVDQFTAQRRGTEWQPFYQTMTAKPGQPQLIFERTDTKTEGLPR